MELREDQRKLLEYVKSQHGEQKRKYTGEPYWNHVYSVAEIVSEYDVEGIEVALCHDLFEDTDCDFSKLHKELVIIGYNARESYQICKKVSELTDIYIHEFYPHWNRKTRKQKEAERLGGVSSLAQTVKYADLIDNTKSIVEYDKDFAKVYLSEKSVLLDEMLDGDSELYDIACNSLHKASKEIALKTN